jgi:hypothetical protein
MQRMLQSAEKRIVCTAPKKPHFSRTNMGFELGTTDSEALALTDPPTLSLSRAVSFYWMPPPQLLHAAVRKGNGEEKKERSASSRGLFSFLGVARAGLRFAASASCRVEETDVYMDQSNITGLCQEFVTIAVKREGKNSFSVDPAAWS